MLILLLGTSNRHKVKEIRALLGGLPLRIVGAEVLPRRIEPAEEGATFEENARLKAGAFARAALELPGEGRPDLVLADDSGLEVDALDGAPGVRSARFAGEPPSDAANNRKLLEALRGVEPPKRGAAFVCVAAMARVPGGGAEPPLLFVERGECRGRIAASPRGEGGFGYDPLFLVDAERTYAELSEDEKNRISHRGRAMALVRARLEELLAPAGRSPASPQGRPR